MLRKLMQRDIPEQFRVGYAGRTLLVDTDPVDLAACADILESQGHEVVKCGSYAEGVQRLRTGKFDLAIIEQGGADFEARVVLEQLSALSPRIPTLVLARFLDMRCYLNAMGLGADDYLEKPVSSYDLRRAIEAHVAPRISMGAGFGQASVT